MERDAGRSREHERDEHHAQLGLRDRLDPEAGRLDPGGVRSHVDALFLRHDDATDDGHIQGARRSAGRRHREYDAHDVQRPGGRSREVGDRRQRAHRDGHDSGPQPDLHVPGKRPRAGESDDHGLDDPLQPDLDQEAGRVERAHLERLHRLGDRRPDGPACGRRHLLARRRSGAGGHRLDDGQARAQQRLAAASAHARRLQVPRQTRARLVQVPGRPGQQPHWGLHRFRDRPHSAGEGLAVHVHAELQLRRSHERAPRAGLDG